MFLASFSQIPCKLKGLNFTSQVKFRPFENRYEVIQKTIRFRGIMESESRWQVACIWLPVPLHKKPYSPVLSAKPVGLFDAIN